MNKFIVLLSLFFVLSLLPGCSCPSGEKMEEAQKICQQISDRIMAGANDILMVLRFILVSTAVFAFMVNGMQIIWSHVGGSNPQFLAIPLRNMILLVFLLVFGLILPYIFNSMIEFIKTIGLLSNA